MISQRTDLDERVLSFSGPESSMHYVARFTEEPVTETLKSEAKKSATASKHAAAKTEKLQNGHAEDHYPGRGRGEAAGNDTLKHACVPLAPPV